MNRKSVLVSTLLAASIFTGTTHAVTISTTFTVGATVLSTCLVAATPLSFGNYAPATTLDSTNLITATCTIGTPYNIGLNAGTGTGATVASRKMTLLTNLLNYSLYADAGRTTVWGNTIGTDTLSATALLLPTVHTVYGRVFSGQNVPIGAYADVINVSLDY